MPCRDAAIAKQPPASAPAGQQPRPGQPRPPSYPQLMARSAHHALISAVGDAHPAFCGTVRVTKRWAQQQLLSQHLGQEALELVCAAAFTQPALTAPPGTGSPRHGPARAQLEAHWGCGAARKNVRLCFCGHRESGQLLREHGGQEGMMLSCVAAFTQPTLTA